MVQQDRGDHHVVILASGQRLLILGNLLYVWRAEHDAHILVDLCNF